MLILCTFYPLRISASILCNSFACLNTSELCCEELFKHQKKMNQSMCVPPPTTACVCVHSRFIPRALCHSQHISASAALGHRSFIAEPKLNSWHPKASELCPRTMLSIPLSSVPPGLPASPSASRGEPPDFMSVKSTWEAATQPWTCART